jgi:hypothetical protein
MSSADKILEKMRNSKAGWRYNDVERVYLGHGFEMRHGSDHAVFFHPVHKQLRTTVARHNPIPVGYVQTAIKLIDQATALDKGQEEAK